MNKYSYCAKCASTRYIDQLTDGLCSCCLREEETISWENRGYESQDQENDEDIDVVKGYYE